MFVCIKKKHPNSLPNCLLCILCIYVDHKIEHRHIHWMVDIILKAIRRETVNFYVPILRK